MCIPLRRAVHNSKSLIYKMFRIAYYRFMFNTNILSKNMISNFLRSLEVSRGEGDIPVSKNEWEAQYSGGQWAYMRDLDELTRYSITEGYFKHIKWGGSLLDVGCGEGIFQQLLTPGCYSKYVGIDLSEVAIKRASANEDERTFFICANALTYIPDEKYDAIIFNETLYYFDDPLKVVEKYSKFLGDDGIIITILYLNSHRATSIWKALVTAYQPLDEVQATNKSKSWVFNVFKISRGYD